MAPSKTAFQSFLLILILSTSAAAQATGDNSFYGNYHWENNSTEKYSKNVDLEVKPKGAGAISISLDIAWDPGAHVEIGGSANTADVSTSTQSDGTVIYTVPFSFADGFNNRGTGRLTIHGNECLVSLTATEVADGRAARQYSDYTLQRQN